jgi:hypothetical protein
MSGYLDTNSIIFTQKDLCLVSKKIWGGGEGIVNLLQYFRIFLNMNFFF